MYLHDLLSSIDNIKSYLSTILREWQVALGGLHFICLRGLEAVSHPTPEMYTVSAWAQYMYILQGKANVRNKKRKLY